VRGLELHIRDTDGHDLVPPGARDLELDVVLVHVCEGGDPYVSALLVVVVRTDFVDLGRVWERGHGNSLRIFSR